MKLLWLLLIVTASGSIMESLFRGLSEFLLANSSDSRDLAIYEDFVLEKYGRGSVNDMARFIRLDIDVRVKPVDGVFEMNHSGNIVVIPDVHGDATNFLRTLWMGLVSVDKIRISFEAFSSVMLKAATQNRFPDTELSPQTNTVLVQLGDIMDRGPHSLLCLRLLWVVERVIGWRVVSLFGNHEIMMTTPNADYYMHPSEKADFEASTFKSRKQAFAPGGAIWTKLAEESYLAAKVGNTMFVHAGFDTKWLSKVEWTTLNDYLNRAQPVLETSPGTQASIPLINGEDSLLWTRIFERVSDQELCERFLPVLLRRLDVARIVVGHMPQMQHRMKSKCGGQIVLTDVAMSRWLAGDAGQPALLFIRHESTGQSVSSVYLSDNEIEYEFVSDTRSGESKIEESRKSKTFSILKIEDFGPKTHLVEYTLTSETSHKLGVLDCHAGADEFDRLVRVAKFMAAGKWQLGLEVADLVDSQRSGDACVLFKAYGGLVVDKPIDLGVLEQFVNKIHGNNILTNVGSIEELVKLFATNKEGQVVLISFGHFVACNGPCPQDLIEEESALIQSAMDLDADISVLSPFKVGSMKESPRSVDRGIAVLSPISNEQKKQIVTILPIDDRTL